jgi:hypothetical protein
MVNTSLNLLNKQYFPVATSHTQIGFISLKNARPKFSHFDNYKVFHSPYVGSTSRARIFKLFRSPGIDSKEAIPPGSVAWRAGKIALFLLGS